MKYLKQELARVKQGGSEREQIYLEEIATYQKNLNSMSELLKNAEESAEK